MASRTEILTKLTEMQGRVNALTIYDRQYIEEAHSAVLRREFVKRNCSDCYRDALILMIIHLQKNNIMPKSNFQLKNGVVLQSAGIAEVVTNANITDKLAEKFLKENPKRLKFFAVYPKKWNETAVELGMQAPEIQTDEDGDKGDETKNSLLNFSENEKDGDGNKES